MAQRGRASIFRGKHNGKRVQGILTKIGGRKLEQSRRELGRLYQRVMGIPAGSVSDADVIEFLARGVVNTVKYLTDAGN